jgi:hypothetical protein
MELAVNYSETLLSLLEINPDLPVDYIKIPTIPFPGCWRQIERGATYRKLLPHLAQPGVIALGHPHPEQRFQAGTVLEVLRVTGAKYLSTHIDAKVDYLPELAEFQHQRQVELERRLQEQFLSAIAEVKRQIPVPLVLENHPYYRWSRQYRVGSEPDFIGKLCEEADCGFLLDIAHARCTAWFLRQPEAELIMKMPLGRLREIHLAGTQLREEGLRDTHTAMTETDYALFEAVLRRAEPEIVSIEYGGLPDTITNPDGGYGPISRNDPAELLLMIQRVKSIIG